MLTVETTNVKFSCIGIHGESTGGDPIYKIMSRQRLSDDELDAYVFERRSSSVVRADWNASGAYTDLKPAKFWPPFVLRNRLFYANMESRSRAWRRRSSPGRVRRCSWRALPL